MASSHLPRLRRALLLHISDYLSATYPGLVEPMVDLSQRQLAVLLVHQLHHVSLSRGSLVAKQRRIAPLLNRFDREKTSRLLSYCAPEKVVFLAITLLNMSFSELLR